MTKEHWERIQMLCEDIMSELNDMNISTMETAADNISSYVDAIYCACEHDYCDDSTKNLPHGYEEIWPMLPDGNSLSVGDMNRLKEHIQAWKEGN